MDFKALSAKRFRTRVDVVPSSPDGYFRIDDEPSFPPYAVGSITLLGIKQAEVMALRRGDVSAMSGYVVLDASRPGLVSFTNCDALITDPLQAVGASRYVGGAQEVRLDRSESQINDAHRVIGEWWAQRLLHPTMDTGEGRVVHPSIPDAARAVLLQRAGDFALILADLSRNSRVPRISVEYGPDPTLREAAHLALVPPPVSFKTYTAMSDDVVMAREGRSGEITQIWPPTPEMIQPAS